MNDELKVYLDTSAVSYLDQQDSPEKMIITQNAWKELCSGKYEVVVSDVLFNELSKCENEKFERLISYVNELPLVVFEEETDENVLLALKLIEHNIVKDSSFEDALHIATALRSNCDILLSWDMKHIVNIKTVNKVKQFCFLYKFKVILDIYTPEYLINGEEEE